MFKKSASALLLLMTLCACASSAPRVIQATSSMQDIKLSIGMATQVEMPEGSKVQTVTVGNPNLLTAEQASDVVSLIAKGSAGETNLIIRARDEDDKIKVYQYKIVVQEH